MKKALLAIALGSVAASCTRTSERPQRDAAPQPAAPEAVEVLAVGDFEELSLELPVRDGWAVRAVLPPGFVDAGTRVRLERITAPAAPAGFDADSLLTAPVRLTVTETWGFEDDASTYGEAFLVFEQARESLAGFGLASDDESLDGQVVGLIEGKRGLSYTRLAREGLALSQDATRARLVVPIRGAVSVRLARSGPGLDGIPQAPRLFASADAAADACDRRPPVVTGSLSFAKVTDTSATVVWSEASDETTSNERLKYRLVKGKAAAQVDTVAKVKLVETGDVLMDFTAATVSKEVIGVADIRNLFFAVVVEDESGNQSVYRPARPDAAAPAALVVTGVSSDKPDGTYGGGESIPITITFSGEVGVSGTPTLALATTPARTASYSYGTGTNKLTFVYSVQDGDATADLDYASSTALTLAGGSIVDQRFVGALLQLPAPGASGSLGASKALVISSSSTPAGPAVTGVSSSMADGSYYTGDVIPITVTFASAVEVTGTPTLSLATGTTARSATYASGTGSAALVFNYTIQTGDLANDLDYASTGALALGGGTIKSASGVNAALALPAPGGAGSLGANKALKVNVRAFARVDGDATGGINYDTSDLASEPVLAVYNGVLYAAWCESTANDQVRVKRLVAGNWVAVDGGSGLNYDTNDAGCGISMAVFGTKLYVAWAEVDSGTAIGGVRVKSYDGTTWTSADGNAALNKNTGESVLQTTMAVHGASLFLAWPEARSGDGDQMRVRAFNGTTWSFVDGDAATGLNKDVEKSAAGPQMSSFGGQLLAAWGEGDTMRAAAYNGTSWSFVDGNATTGLEYASGATFVRGATLAVLGSTLYLAWQEEVFMSPSQLRVRAYDGTTWTSADGNGATGINVNPSENASYASLAVIDGGLYGFWVEEASGMAAPAQARAKAFRAGAWVSIDGGGPTGLNKDTGAGAAVVVGTATFGKHIYVSWAEAAPSLGADQIRVSRY